MVTFILYQPDTETERPARDLAKRLERERIDVRLVDGNSLAGTSLTELYDLPSRPAVVVIQNDGTIVESWQHELPALDDIAYLARGK